MKEVLFVGHSPIGITGNSRFMAGILKNLNQTKYHPIGFFAFEESVSGVNFNFPLVQSFSSFDPETSDPWGKNKLLHFLSKVHVDILVFVGIDCWRYSDIYPTIKKIARNQKFKTIGIFPYDLHFLNKEWVKLFNFFDIPCVYSQYGFEMLKNDVPKLRYFHPPMIDSEFYKPFTPEGKIKARRELFPHLNTDDFLFGFVGRNQFRKDPQRALKAFIQTKSNWGSGIRMYMHTTPQAVFNLPAYGVELQRDGLESGDLTFPSGISFSTQGMCKVYNCMDAFVLPSLQEGLSWTVIEAMLCGIPCIISNSTSHKDFKGAKQLLVSCEELAYVPLETSLGGSFVESKACNLEELTKYMSAVVGDVKLREAMSISGIEFANKWCSESNDVNALLNSAKDVVHPVIRKDQILFAQHSAAGDILMTTQVLRQIKERHKLPLVYMTQKKFAGVLEGNPNIDNIIDWDESLMEFYHIVYNPHGTKILPGGWNNLDTPLHSMYPYFCDTKDDDMFIRLDKPVVALPSEPFVVVHTSGGQKEYRTYPHMERVIENLGMPTVQIGSPEDRFCSGVTLDLRGKLSFTESAYVVSEAKACVCVDSFISHLCGAVGTDAVVLYGPAPARVVGPKVKNSCVINIEPDMLKVCEILSHCWGNPPTGKEKCRRPCISTINPEIVQAALYKILGKKPEKVKGQVIW